MPSNSEPAPASESEILNQYYESKLNLRAKHDRAQNIAARIAAHSPDMDPWRPALEAEPQEAE